MGLSLCIRVVCQGGTSSSPGFVSRPDVVLFYFVWKQKDEASITEVWRFVSYSQTKSLVPNIILGCELIFCYLKKARVNQKPRKKPQNYLKASLFDCKCVLLTLLHVSKIYKSIKKDCMIAEDMMAALRNRRKLEFWSWINGCWNPENFFHAVR